MKIKNSNILDEYIDNLFNNINSPADYEIKETHNFTIILPSSYYESGSYNKWIRVGWALKNTNKKLLPTWLKFCSQSKEFSFTDISRLVDLWNKFDYENPDGLTSRSIMYWAKNDNIQEYKKKYQFHSNSIKGIISEIEDRVRETLDNYGVTVTGEVKIFDGLVQDTLNSKTLEPYDLHRCSYVDVDFDFGGAWLSFTHSCQEWHWSVLVSRQKKLYRDWGVGAKNSPARARATCPSPRRMANACGPTATR